MIGKEKSTNSAFSTQQSIQISIACERVQNAINMNLTKTNKDLIHKAEEITLKTKKIC